MIEGDAMGLELGRAMMVGLLGLLGLWVCWFAGFL
jgi:hypothetical protein